MRNIVESILFIVLSYILFLYFIIILLYYENQTYFLIGRNRKRLNVCVNIARLNIKLCNRPRDNERLS
jgi:hypothetical protein